ncbi:MAG: hypothetical protein U0324_42350 [Polyangiales bacterium]
MSLATVCALPYAVLASYLRDPGDPTHRCARIAAAHGRLWIVSITSSPDCPANAFEDWGDGGPAPLVSDAGDRLALAFDDVEPGPDDVASPRVRPFTRAMAERTVDFVARAHRDDPARRDALLVQCHAGVSRSGAVADFARTLAGVPYDDFRRENPQVVPNVWVRRLLFEAWEARGGL